MAKTPYYITTAIAYASGKPHIGNTYEIVLADAIARYKRFIGYDVQFQTGTDEHGQKIETKAFESLSTPKEFVDEKAGEIKRIWDLMNTSYDKFIRTTKMKSSKKERNVLKTKITKKKAKTKKNTRRRKNVLRTKMTKNTKRKENVLKTRTAKMKLKKKMKSSKRKENALQRNMKQKYQN